MKPGTKSDREMGDATNSNRLLETYKASHQHPVNHLCHAIGIPLILLSLPVFFWNWRWALSAFVGGWILQFVGHFVEGTPPAFLSHPRYLLIGPYWWLKKMFGPNKK